MFTVKNIFVAAAAAMTIAGSAQAQQVSPVQSAIQHTVLKPQEAAPVTMNSTASIMGDCRPAQAQDVMNFKGAALEGNQLKITDGTTVTNYEIRTSRMSPEVMLGDVFQEGQRVSICQNIGGPTLTTLSFQ